MDMDIEECEIESIEDAIQLSDSKTFIYFCEIEAPNKFGVNAVSGSVVYAGYTGFYMCQQAFNADGTSTINKAFCHLNFVEL
jgi:hypothetical protein